MGGGRGGKACACGQNPLGHACGVPAPERVQPAENKQNVNSAARMLSLIHIYGVEFEGAYRAKDKDLLRALARDLEQKDPWVLLSRPMKEADGFVEQSLSERASERRARLSLIHI